MTEEQTYFFECMQNSCVGILSDIFSFLKENQKNRSEMMAVIHFWLNFLMSMVLVNFKIICWITYWTPVNVFGSWMTPAWVFFVCLWFCESRSFWCNVCSFRCVWPLLLIYRHAPHTLRNPSPLKDSVSFSLKDTIIVPD